MQSEAGVRWSEPTRAQYSKANTTKMDAAIVSAVNELEHILSLKDEQTIALKAFLEEKHVSAVLPTGYGEFNFPTRSDVVYNFATGASYASCVAAASYVAGCAD